MNCLLKEEWGNVVGSKLGSSSCLSSVKLWQSDKILDLVLLVYSTHNNLANGCDVPRRASGS